MQLATVLSMNSLCRERRFVAFIATILQSIVCIEVIATMRYDQFLSKELFGECCNHNATIHHDTR